MCYRPIQTAGMEKLPNWEAVFLNIFFDGRKGDTSNPAY